MRFFVSLKTEHYFYSPDDERKVVGASIQARLAQIRRFDLFAELAKTYLRTKTPHSPANWQKY
ncbi:MAG: hypothetical protein LBI30_03980, partial [Holosporales bacterium]|nr:hypothetical protein [Holosporales bacterium]